MVLHQARGTRRGLVLCLSIPLLCCFARALAETQHGQFSTIDVDAEGVAREVPEPAESGEGDDEAATYDPSSAAPSATEGADDLPFDVQGWDDFADAGTFAGADDAGGEGEGDGCLQLREDLQLQRLAQHEFDALPLIAGVDATETALRSALVVGLGNNGVGGMADVASLRGQMQRLDQPNVFGIAVAGIDDVDALPEEAQADYPLPRAVDLLGMEVPPGGASNEDVAAEAVEPVLAELQRRSGGGGDGDGDGDASPRSCFDLIFDRTLFPQLLSPEDASVNIESLAWARYAASLGALACPHAHVLLDVDACNTAEGGSALPQFAADRVASALGAGWSLVFARPTDPNSAIVAMERGQWAVPPPPGWFVLLRREERQRGSSAPRSRSHALRLAGQELEELAATMRDEPYNGAGGALHEELRRNGHVSLPSLLSGNVTAALRDVVLRAADAGAWEPQRSNVYDYVYTPLEAPKPWLRVRNVRKDSDALRAFECSGVLAETAAQLLGVGDVRVYQDSVFVSYPGDAASAWAVDAVAMPLQAERAVTLTIALSDAAESTGGMRFATGSHAATAAENAGEGSTVDFSGDETPFALDEVPARTLAEPELALRGLDSHARMCALRQAHWAAQLDGNVERTWDVTAGDAALRAGDATAHMGWTYHASTANDGAAPREGFAVTFVDAAARLRDDLLTPDVASGGDSDDDGDSGRDGGEERGHYGGEGDGDDDGEGDGEGELPSDRSAGVPAEVEGGEQVVIEVSMDDHATWGDWQEQGYLQPGNYPPMPLCSAEEGDDAYADDGGDDGGFEADWYG